MEIKWIVIGIVAWAAVMFGGMSIESYNKNQCRIEALRALVKPELIESICK
jgi:hypothetical protein